MLFPLMALKLTRSLISIFGKIETYYFCPIQTIRFKEQIIIILLLKML